MDDLFWRIGVLSDLFWRIGVLGDLFWRIGVFSTPYKGPPFRYLGISGVKQIGTRAVFFLMQSHRGIFLYLILNIFLPVVVLKSI